MKDEWRWSPSRFVPESMTQKYVQSICFCLSFLLLKIFKDSSDSCKIRAVPHGAILTLVGNISCKGNEGYRVHALWIVKVEADNNGP